MSKKAKTVISLICNLLVVLLVCYAVIHMVKKGTSFSECLDYFTTDSNILCAITCLVMAICEIRGKGMVRSTLIFKLVGTVSVTVTFITVMVFLGPTVGYEAMFEDEQILLHLICPVLAMVSFMFFEADLMTDERWISADRRRPLQFKDSLYGLLPTVIYGALYYYQVIVTEWWPDFYGFNSGILEGLWYVSIFAMLFGTFIISTIEWSVHNLCCTNKHIKRNRGY